MPFPQDGVLVVDKPAGPTSHDIVLLARRALQIARIGHTGTLDPFATGVLPLALGRATRLARFLTAGDKEYVADVRFGAETDTYDATGQVTAESPARPDQAGLTAALAQFEGRIQQAPPPFSAKQIDGQRLYALARRGTALAPAPVEVHISQLALECYADGVARIRVVCSAGTYIRVLAHELGRAAGTCACLQALRRVRSGEFDLDGAVLPDRLGDVSAVARAFRPMERLLAGWRVAVLTNEGLRRASHGNEVGPAHLDSVPAARQPIKLVDRTGRLVAVAEPASPGGWHPSVVLVDATPPRART